MRKLIADGVCACCGRVGAVWWNEMKPIDTGTDLIFEPNTSLPDLCDTCNYAQQRWDARQYELRCFTAGYPYAEGPPRTPPVRREGDVDLGPDGWPKRK